MRLALPIMAAQMFQMGMSVLDVVMAGRLSPDDAAGILLGGAVFWPTQILVGGMITAAVPIIAQLHGAGRVSEVGEVVRQGAWVALAAAAIVVGAIQQADLAYGLVGADPAAAAIAVRYLDALSLGVPAVSAYFLLRHLCDGLGRTRPAMAITALALVLKAPLTWALVYGRLGLPQLGGAGCGWATAAVMWFELAAILVVVRTPFYRPARLFERFSAPDPKALARFARIGIPIGATTFFEVGVYSLVNVLLGGFGAKVVAAHGIAGNLNGITFMIPLALGIATTIRVGHHVGAENYERARSTARVAMGVSVGFAILAGAALFVLREPVAWLYTRDPEVWALATNVILFVAAYQLVDDTQVTAIGALRGYKDTRTPMWIALAGYWIVALPIACALGYGWGPAPSWGIYGFWTGLTCGLGFVAVLVGFRLRRISADFERVRALSEH